MADSTIFDSGMNASFTATATLSAYQLVALETDGTVSVATATSSQTEVGFLIGERSVSPGESAPIKLLNGGGSVYATAEATVTVGNALYPASAGKVGTTTFTDSPQIGTALNSGVADDDIAVLLA